VPALRIVLAEPCLGHEQPLVHQSIAMTRGIGGKHPNLTMLHLAESTAILPGHSHGLLPFFHKARLLHHQHALGITHLGGDQPMIRLAPLVFVPDIITDEALHAADVAPRDLECHGLNGFAFECTELAHHIVEEMPAGLATSKTGAEVVMESLEFIQESFDIAGGELKPWEGEPLVWRATFR
jgi:hypothetical protein